MASSEIDNSADLATSTNTVEIAESKVKVDMIVRSLAVLNVNMALRELDRVIENEAISAYSEGDLLPYIAAVFTLAFVGKDVDGESVRKLVSAAGIVPDVEIIGKILRMHIKNSIPYAAAIYFLVSIGIEPNVDALIQMVGSMDIHPDASMAGYAITFYKLYKDSAMSER